MKIIKISPSNLTFLLNECSRCFYMTAHKIYSRPYSAFPSIFNKIDKLMRGNYQGKSSLKITGKEGTFDTKEYKVQSEPEMIDSNTAIQFSGKTDCLINFVDCTKGIMDFKTSEVKEASVVLYSPQIYAYRECYIPTVKVSRMGLLCGTPTRAFEVPPEIAACPEETGLGLSQTWVEIPIDEAYWYDFKSKLFNLLLTPFEEVQGKPSCPHCDYQRRLQS